MKTFPKLLVADKAQELAHEVLSLEDLDREDVLTHMLFEEALRIPALIARAGVSDNPTEFATDIDPAVSAAYRLETLILVAADVGFIPAKSRASLEARVEEVRKMLVALRASARRGFAGSPRRRPKLTTG